MGGSAGLLGAWKRLASRFYDQLGYDTARLADPALVGPIAAPRLRVAIAWLASLSVAASITAVIVAPFSPLHALALLLVALVSVGLYHALPPLWRAVLASGIEQELPAVLVYLVPYSASPKYIADVIATLPSGVFRWFRHESGRLRLLLDMGLDPLEALRRMAETTPSRRLREVLIEYTSLQLIGAQSSEASIRLLDRAIAMVREKWAQYREAGRAIVELGTAGLISIVALAPMTGSLGGAILGMGLAMILSSLYLLIARPRLGDWPAPTPAPATILGSSIAGSLLALEGHTAPALAVLAAGALAAEALHWSARRTMRRALQSLRTAAEKARLGLDYTRELAQAQPLGGPVRAVLEASTVAGSIGVGQALIRLVHVIEEAGEQRRRAGIEAAILEAVSAASPPILALATARLGSLLAGGAPLLPAAISPQPIIALAPLAPLPAAILRRGRTATPLAGLASLLVTLYLAS